MNIVELFLPELLAIQFFWIAVCYTVTFICMYQWIVPHLMNTIQSRNDKIQQLETQIEQIKQQIFTIEKEYLNLDCVITNQIHNGKEKLHDAYHKQWLDSQQDIVDQIQADKILLIQEYNQQVKQLQVELNQYIDQVVDNYSNKTNGLY